MVFRMETLAQSLDDCSSTQQDSLHLGAATDLPRSRPYYCTFDPSRTGQSGQSFWKYQEPKPWSIAGPVGCVLRWVLANIFYRCFGSCSLYYCDNRDATLATNY